MIKTPVLNPDGSYHLIDRCKHCPDMRLKIIRSKWVGERHDLASLEYLIRGEFRVLTREEWESRETLDKHVRSDQYRTILAAMDLAREPPEIQFCGIASTAGMERIEELQAKF